MKTQKQKLKTTENAKLARKYRVTERTVRNWKAEGAPISDPSKLSDWLAGRKQCPKVTDGATTPPATAPAPMGEAQETGAPAALHRLEIAEEEAYRRFESVIPAGDAVAIRNSREEWLKLCHNLRLFEAGIDENRRKQGELVERKTVEESLRFLGTCIRQGANHHALIPLSMKLIDEPDIHRIRTVIKQIWNHNNLLAFAQMCTAPTIPEWVTTALSEDCRNLSPRQSMEELAAIGKILDEAFQHAVRVSKTTPERTMCEWLAKTYCPLSDEAADKLLSTPPVKRQTLGESLADIIGQPPGTPPPVIQKDVQCKTT